MFGRNGVVLVIGVLIGVLGWAYQALTPPPPRICGSPGGPPVTAPRVKLRDGRYLAYKEHGVPKHTATHKIIFIHGFATCRHDATIANTLSPDVVEELGVYIVSIDRPGYGESDPHPKRTVKTLALDIEELADSLELGSKFYVIGFSMGGQQVWTCLKYIPHRLAGAVLLTPVVNYWWPRFPANLSIKAYRLQIPQEQWTLGVAHYLPWLTFWWNTQKWFPSSGVASGHPAVFSTSDLQILAKYVIKPQHEAQRMQQGEYESLHRDLMIGFGSWEFDPMDLENPFPNNEGSVHLWQGSDDKMVPTMLQRYIAKQLPWIEYHEVEGAGHMFPRAHGMSEAILKSLLLHHKY